MSSNAVLTPLDKYLMLGANVYQIYKTEKKQDIFVHDGKVVWYDPQIDGATLSWEQIEENHPEVLI